MNSSRCERDADAEREQLGPVRVEAPGERLVGHLRVALDRVLRVARRDRPALGHQVRDERELPDQLVAVMTQSRKLHYRHPGGSYARWATRVVDSSGDGARGRPPRPRRLLRGRRGSRTSGARGPAAGGRRQPRRPGRGVDRELRGAGVRHPLGDVGGRGPATLPAGRLRPPQHGPLQRAGRARVWTLVERPRAARPAGRHRRGLPRPHRRGRRPRARRSASCASCRS